MLLILFHLRPSLDISVVIDLDPNPVRSTTNRAIFEELLIHPGREIHGNDNLLAAGVADGGDFLLHSCLHLLQALRHVVLWGVRYIAAGPNHPPPAIDVQKALAWVEERLGIQLAAVTFDERRVEYDFSDLDELALALVLSIHKSQGSEFPCVVIPLHTRHYLMLRRNLLYTALTRGRKLVVLVGTKKALAIAVRRVDTGRRYTALRQRLERAMAAGRL